MRSLLAPALLALVVLGLVLVLDGGDGARRGKPPAPPSSRTDGPLVEPPGGGPADPAIASAVCGKVLAEGGGPIDRAIVKAGERGTLTGVDGRFRLGGLPPGEALEIAAAAEGYRSAAARATPGPGEGALLPDPLVLQPLPGLVGRAVDPAGEPLPGVRVAMEREGAFRGGTAVTDSGGRYHFDNPEPGGFALVFRHPEYRARRLEGLLHVAGERTVAPDVKLEPGGEIAGRVLDEEGRPVIGAELVLTPADVDRAYAAPVDQLRYLDLRAQSDAAGAFRIPGLEPGTYFLAAAADNHLPWTRESVEVSAPGVTEITAVLSRGRGISGVVRNTAGNPVAGARVEWRDYGLGPDLDHLRFRGYRECRAETDARGRFLLTGFEAEGEIDFEVEAEGFARLDVEGVAPGARDLEITLRRPGGVRGRVVDASTGTPVSGAWVVMSPGNVTQVDMHTAGDGRFELSGIRPGTHEVGIDAPGAVRIDVEVVVKEGETTDMGDVPVGEGAALRGRVVRLSDGFPVHDATVRLEQGEDAEQEETDLLGRFAFRGARAGLYRLVVTAHGFASPKPLEVEVPGSGEIVVRLGRGGTVRGIVRRVDGEPAEGIRVSLVGEGDPFRAPSKRTKEDGSFEFEAVPPGKYEILAMVTRDDPKVGFSVRSGKIAVVEGEESFLELGGPSEDSHGALRARLTHRGAPVADMDVILLKMGDVDRLVDLMRSMFRAKTGPDGRFEVEDAGPGRYRVALGRPAGPGFEYGFDMEVVPGENDIELPEGSLSGRLVFAGGGTDSAMVFAVDPDAIRAPIEGVSDLLALFVAATETRVDGSFEFPMLPPGPVTLMVAREALWFVDGLRATPETGAPVRIELPPAHDFLLIVRDGEGAPVAGAEALLFDGEGRRCLTTDDPSEVTGSDGEAKMRIAPGPHRLVILAPNFAPGVVELDLDRDTERSVRLSPGATVEASVAGVSGPVEGARIRVFARGAEVPDHLTIARLEAGGGGRLTSDEGTVRIRGLPPGRLRLVAEVADGRRGEVEVEAAAGETTEARIDLR